MRVFSLVLYALCGVTFAASITGCAPAREAQQVPGTQRMRITGHDGNNVDTDGDGDRSLLSGANHVNNPPINLTAVRNADLANGGPLSFGDRLADLARGIPDVSSARAVVDGQDVFIAIRLKREIAAVPRRADAVRKEIRTRIMTHAPIIKNVFVATARSQVALIERVCDQLHAGSSMDAVRGQLTELHRTVPAVPPVDAPHWPPKTGTAP